MQGKGELKILTPIGLLGYGFPEADFWKGIEAGADAIVVDAGSTDPGPYLLGLGKMIVSEAALTRDLRILLAGAVQKRIPLLIGSALGCGRRSTRPSMSFAGSLRRTGTP